MAHEQPKKEQTLFVIDKTPSENVVDDESIEKALEDAVFGTSRNPFARGDGYALSSHDSAESGSDAECGEKKEEDEEEEEAEAEDERKKVPAKLNRLRSSGSWRKRQPVWEDEDDQQVM